MHAAGAQRRPPTLGRQRQGPLRRPGTRANSAAATGAQGDPVMGTYGSPLESPAGLPLHVLLLVASAVREAR